jgi:hypothetical protein
MLGERFLDCLTLEMKVVHFLETSGTSRPMTQHHIPEDLNP